MSSSQLTSQQIVDAAINRLLELRPDLIIHINNPSSALNRIFTAWRAQANLALIRRTTEQRAAYAGLASGQALLDYAYSELGLEFSAEDTFAVGEVFLTRSTGTLPAGVIRAGTRFNIVADPNGQPVSLPGCEYRAINTVSVQSGDTLVQVPIQASEAGLKGNIPFSNLSLFSDMTSTELFDSNFTTLSAFAAGATSGNPSDAYIRSLVKASALARAGATNDGVLYSVLKTPGVRHAYCTNSYVDGTNVYIADDSWTYSSAFSDRVRNSINTDGKGFGTKFTIYGVRNRYVTVTANVTLRSRQYSGETSELDDLIEKAIRSYFDDRERWFDYQQASLRAAIQRADRRILACTSVTVSDYSGSPIAENSAPQIHYALVGSSVTYGYP